MATPRYEAAVERNLAEMHRALLDLELMRAMDRCGGFSTDEAKGTYYALFNDYIAHCIKVLENRPGAASLFYIYRTNQGPLDAAAAELGVDIARLAEMGEKLKHVRDKTHFHIDHEGVLDTKSVWRDANINGKELADAVVHVWGLLNAARIALGKERLQLPKVDHAAVTRATQILNGADHA